MKQKISFIITGILISILATACGPDQKTQDLAERSKKIFGTLPEKMPGSNKDSAELIALGKKLYFEKKLSLNDSQSCNSCHMLEDKKAGVDNLPTSPGAEGKLGGRNSPTVLNAGFHIAQFWDGRAEDLVAQAKGPILNPIEMGMPSEKAVIEKISALEEYKEAFAAAFPRQENAITYQNIAEAIAAFERTLITKDRFDDFQKGNLKALTKAEVDGLDTFVKTGCVQCHMGPLLGATSYRKMGQVNPYENTEDLGRYDVTKNEADKYLFKVPSLRNVALTAPYFHDGKVAKLEEAVKKMAWMQLGKEISDEEVNKIVTFLKALSDKDRI